MRIGLIINFGVFSAILLIFSCIILKAPELYNECSTTASTSLVKPVMVLRDRN